MVMVMASALSSIPKEVNAPVVVRLVKVPAAGVVAPIVASTVPALMSAVVATREAMVPKLVTLAWAAVARVPVMEVAAVRVVKAPVEALDAPMAVPSIAPAPMSTVGRVAVPENVGEAELALELTAV